MNPSNRSGPVLNRVVQCSTRSSHSGARPFVCSLARVGGAVGNEGGATLAPVHEMPLELGHAALPSPGQWANEARQFSVRRSARLNPLGMDRRALRIPSRRVLPAGNPKRQPCPAAELISACEWNPEKAAGVPAW